MKKFSSEDIGTSEPCDYFHYDLYSDELVLDILKNDYNIVINTENEYRHTNMENAIGKKSFGGIFKDIF